MWIVEEVREERKSGRGGRPCKISGVEGRGPRQGRIRPRLLSPPPPPHDNGQGMGGGVLSGIVLGLRPKVRGDPLHWTLASSPVPLHNNNGQRIRERGVGIGEGRQTGKAYC